jgi:ABC transport system ATP-binding/permease protein
LWRRRSPPSRTAKPKFRMDAAYELIENEPPPRDTVSLASMAMQRLGKDVVDLENVSVSYGEGPEKTEVLKNITWRIAPGERTGVLGVNGAGKSTLLSLISGELRPTSGKVKRGKTIKVATLTQQLGELEDVWEDRVSEVIGRLKSSYVTGGKEMTPTQLLERVGFSSAQLSTPVKDLSGGQQRRLQLLLILLSEPNVLILDEPTNDLDTDILAAIEDLLDSFAGTLLVVSHDRYLIERVTDQQYAVMDGGFRHLPRGVEQYLELRRKQDADAARTAAPAAPTASGLQGAELRNAQKELASVTRKMEKTTGRIDALHARFAAFDQSDYEGLGALSEELRLLQESLGALESRWLEVSQALES